MSLSHIFIIAAFFFIGGLGMASVQSAFSAFNKQLSNNKRSTFDASKFAPRTRKLVWK